MTRLVLAARYLTIVPVPGAGHAGLGEIGRAAAWFPVVGLALGGVLAITERLTGRLFPPLLAALLVVTMWKILSGGLHLDGLADCLDGLAGGGAARRLAIMRDSRIGAFGVVGLILFLFLEIAALAEIAPATRWRALLVVPAIGRATPVLLARLYPPARPDGHGAAFSAGVGRLAAPVAALVALAVAVAMLGVLGVVVTAMAFLAALGFASLVTRGLGGITGDVLGGGVETAELAALLTIAAWMHARL